MCISAISYKFGVDLNGNVLNQLRKKRNVLNRLHNLLAKGNVCFEPIEKKHVRIKM
mgnify:CR=1 FL=1